MNYNWKSEIARDFIALGSWVFYALVVVRALIGTFRPFSDQLIIAGIFIGIISLCKKNTNPYLARAIVLAVFTSLFYRNASFSLFVGIVLLIFIFLGYHLNKRFSLILKGFFIGFLSVLLGYFLPGFYL